MSFARLVDENRDRLSTVISEEDFHKILSENQKGISISYEVYRDQETIREMLLVLTNLASRVEALEAELEMCDE